MELRQSAGWGRYLQSLGWETEIVEGCAARIKKLGPFGSIIKVQRPHNLPLEKITQLAKRHQALFVKIEPVDESQLSILNSQFYSPDSWPLIPSRTIFVNLTKSEDELLKSFSKDTRQTIKKVQSAKCKVQSFSFEGIDEKKWALKSFYRIWQETSRRGKFWIPPFPELLAKVQAFGAESLLLLAFSSQSQTGRMDQDTLARPPNQHPTPGVGDDNGNMANPNCLAGCLLLFCESVAYYHHAASTQEGQELGTPYAVLWRALLEAQKRGAKKFDLEGIFDPRFPSMFKSWLSFSTFKLKWGRQIVEYPPAHTRTFNPLLRILFKLNR